ncbi:hypothetical protein FJZ39_04155 [Candidatus Saccharibacteria bacterium]|nr:hypothetical protein [Candidatus Saccharibacteria bacterium]
MAEYTVPQDVEADDKLLGPFSFRQFIYLIVVAIGLGGAWALFGLFPPLAIIPLPIIIFFSALALPLKKDQPMETYLAAIVQFHLKPKRRLWKPDGITSLVEVTAPKKIEQVLTKNLTEDEAERRLSYLANIVDSRGWSVRGVGVIEPNNSMNTDVFYTAQQTEDILDDTAQVSRNINTMIDRADTERREAAIRRMQQPTTQQQPTQYFTPQAAPTPPVQPTQTYQPQSAPTFNPYPSSMHQSVIQPLSSQPQSPAQQPAQYQAPASAVQTPSVNSVSPDIIDLANNHHDLSVEAIQREADRIHQKEVEQQKPGEVFISLR